MLFLSIQYNLLSLKNKLSLPSDIKTNFIENKIRFIFCRKHFKVVS